MQQVWESGMLSNAWELLQLVVVAALAGWATERLLDTGVRTRGLPFLSGLFGLYVGPYALDMAGWPIEIGPQIAGQPLVAAFAGALLIGCFLKLASLGVAGPRW
jgi:uncharacterized membrane protein YeaQ/YmgE (transglycosylase-associated protein family)